MYDARFTVETTNCTRPRQKETPQVVLAYQQRATVQEQLKWITAVLLNYSAGGAGGGHPAEVRRFTALVQE